MRPIYTITKHVSAEYLWTYCAITVSDGAQLRTFAVMAHGKPSRKGGICWLYLISFEGQKGTLDMHHQKVIPYKRILIDFTQTSNCLCIFNVYLVTIP